VSFNRSIISVFVLLAFVGCSSTTKNRHKKNMDDLKLSDFDKVYIPNEAIKISKMISIVQPELSDKFKTKIASDIHAAVIEYKIEPQIMVALIDTESNFHSDKVSTTGDLSIAQVNVKVWNLEFERMNLPLIDKNELIKPDQRYAIKTMAQILAILKKRFAHKDRRWYARYHSNTTKYKREYLKRIEVRMKMLDSDKSFILAGN
jgi:hypothetical protein